MFGTGGVGWLKFGVAEGVLIFSVHGVQKTMCRVMFSSSDPPLI